MDKELFKDLVQSLNEARSIVRGKKKPSRVFEVKTPDVKMIRERTIHPRGNFYGRRVASRFLNNRSSHFTVFCSDARIILKCECAGFKRTFVSGSATSEGTNSAALRSDASHSSPNARDARQSSWSQPPGRSSRARRSMRTFAGMLITTYF